MTTTQALIPLTEIAEVILTLRGKRVILDADLARLYGVTTKQLNQAVKRNPSRFPEEFMFCLTMEETRELVTNCDRFARLKHSTALPHAFTEHGVVMAASVLNSPRAVEASVYVTRVFVRLRELLAGQLELTSRLERLEWQLREELSAHRDRLDRHEDQIYALLDALHALMDPPAAPPRPIGFRAGEEG